MFKYCITRTSSRSKANDGPLILSRADPHCISVFGNNIFLMIHAISSLQTVKAGVLKTRKTPGARNVAGKCANLVTIAQSLAPLVPSTLHASLVMYYKALFHSCN